MTIHGVSGPLYFLWGCHQSSRIEQMFLMILSNFFTFTGIHSLSFPPSLSLPLSLLPHGTQTEIDQYTNCNCESGAKCILISNCEYFNANNFSTAIQRTSENLQDTPDYQPGRTYYFTSEFTTPLQSVLEGPLSFVVHILFFN